FPGASCVCVRCWPCWLWCCLPWRCRSWQARALPGNRWLRHMPAQLPLMPERIDQRLTEPLRQRKNPYFIGIQHRLYIQHRGAWGQRAIIQHNLRAEADTKPQADHADCRLVAADLCVDLRANAGRTEPFIRAFPCHTFLREDHRYLLPG